MSWFGYEPQQSLLNFVHDQPLTIIVKDFTTQDVDNT